MRASFLSGAHHLLRKICVEVGDLSLTLFLFLFFPPEPSFPPLLNGTKALRSHPPGTFCWFEVVALKESMSLTAGWG